MLHAAFRAYLIAVLVCAVVFRLLAWLFPSASVLVLAPVAMVLVGVVFAVLCQLLVRRRDH